MVIYDYDIQVMISLYVLSFSRSNRKFSRVSEMVVFFSFLLIYRNPDIEKGINMPVGLYI